MNYTILIGQIFSLYSNTVGDGAPDVPFSSYRQAKNIKMAWWYADDLRSSLQKKNGQTCPFFDKHICRLWKKSVDISWEQWCFPDVVLVKKLHEKSFKTDTKSTMRWQTILVSLKIVLEVSRVKSVSLYLCYTLPVIEASVLCNEL